MSVLLENAITAAHFNFSFQKFPRSAGPISWCAGRHVRGPDRLLYSKVRKTYELNYMTQSEQQEVQCDPSFLKWSGSSWRIWKKFLYVKKRDEGAA